MSKPHSSATLVDRLRAFSKEPDPQPAGELSTLEIRMLLAILDSADEIERLRAELAVEQAADFDGFLPAPTAPTIARYRLVPIEDE